MNISSGFSFNRKHNTMAPIIFFDGVCNLCTFSVKFVLKHDKKGKFMFCVLQSDKMKYYQTKYRLLPKDSFILIDNDKIYYESEAFLYVLKQLGNFRVFYYLGRLLPSFIRDGLYRAVARNRYKWFGKKEHCFIPEQHMKKRFLC